jgi:hypothetical protein
MGSQEHLFNIQDRVTKIMSFEQIYVQTKENNKSEEFIDACFGIW